MFKKPVFRKTLRLKKIIFINWLLIALEYWFDFCRTSTSISYRCAYIPSLLNLLPTSHTFPSLFVVIEPLFEFSELWDYF